MKIVIDGNDGTGKTTLALALEREGYEVADRGVPTKMTDDPSVQPADGEFYLILDVPISVSRKRLEMEGKDLTERYHTIEDLTHYRKRFLEVAEELKERCILLDGSKPKDLVFRDAVEALHQAMGTSHAPR